MAYEVRLDNFEGPMDLLLHLIKKNDLDIYDIPISRITSEYLSYIDLMRQLNINVAGEFLVMASTLIQIKVRMLLPRHGEEEQEEDPRDELVQKLIEYKKVKVISHDLRENECKQGQLHSRSSFYFKDDYLTVEATLFDIMEAFSSIISKVDKDYREIIQEEVSVEEKMAHIKGILETREYVILSDLVTEKKSRLEIIALFLALLEMVRLKLVQARQSQIFGQIRIYRIKTLEAVNT